MKKRHILVDTTLANRVEYHHYYYCDDVLARIMHCDIITSYFGGKHFVKFHNRRAEDQLYFMANKQAHV